MPSRITRIGAAVALLGALAMFAFGPAGCRTAAPTARATTSTAISVAATPAPATAATAAPSPATKSRVRTPASAAPKVVFAVIGDYGVHRSQELAVAKLCKHWKASYVVTVGDNYYSSAGGSGSGTYFNSAGWAYGKWMADVPKHAGHVVGKATVNAFFPAVGNEDYDLNAKLSQYRKYFDLPGNGFTSSSKNERYYDFVEGRIHFFMVDSDPREPKGVSATSKQAKWLKGALAASKSDWNIVVVHHPPYTSAIFGESPYMRWPYKKWGADLVLSGHAHVYERMVEGGLTYVDDGLGGASLHPFSSTIAGSKVRFDTAFGAMRGIVQGNKLTLEFWTVGGTRVDHFTIAH